MSVWKEVFLGDLTNKITKGTTPPKGQGFVQTSGINYIKSDAIEYDGTVHQSKFVLIDEETHKRFLRSQLEEDDILFSMAGNYLGKSGIVTNEMLPANTNQALAIIRLNREIALPKYIGFCLRQPNMIKYVNSMSAQSAQPNINFQEIASLQINLPDLYIQKEIVDILDNLDKKITLLRQQNQTLEELAQTLFKHWYVDFNFPDAEGKPYKDNGGKMIESELGEIPEGWRVGMLSELIEVKYGKDHKHLVDGEFPLYGSGGIMRYVERSLYDKPSILIPRKGTLTNIYYLDQPFWSVDTMFYSIIKNSNYGKYCYQHLKRVNFNLLDVGSVIPSLSTSLLNEMELLIPKEKIAEEFEKVLSQLFNKINANKEEIQTLTQLRDTLLPKLMSGEIKI